ncbi:MAG: hypothetical protein AAFQ44_04830 [Pseudomonadota bacterium]
MSARIVPSSRQFLGLIAGGALGLLLWELSARVLAPQIIGGPMEPAGLIQALAAKMLGLQLGKLPAEGVHYATGLIGYPIGYWILSRIVSFGSAIDGVIWGVVTWFLALGVFAWLAGFGFLLGYGNLTWLSLMGHLLYGMAAVSVFHDLAGRR